MIANVRDKERGFSLVELAISVTIIGVLMAGVIKGQELIYNARILTMGNKVEASVAAMNNFYTFYEALPGDVSNANTLIPGCGSGCTYNGSGSGGTGGNGNGIINGIASGSTTDVSNEGRGFWEHLAASYMLNYTTITPGTTNSWGITHPKTPFGGGMIVTYNPSVTTTTTYSGNYFRLSRTFTNGGGAGESLLDYHYAVAYDRKFDDANLAKGPVLGYSKSSACVSTGTGNNCDLLVRFK